MAIVWGTFEGGMRVGIDVEWGAVGTNSDDVTAVVKYYTDNSQSFGDNQTLNLSGHIGGSINYSNNQSGSSGATFRGQRTYTWTYSSSSYGSSPGTRTFTASASGLYTGGTPSRSVTVSIPARPIASPQSPVSLAASRISDTQTKLTWTNRSSAQRPWESLTLQRRTNGGSWVTVTTALSGSASSYTYPTTANNKYEFQLRSVNDVAVSVYDVSDPIYTSPATPGAPARADIAGPGQRITWANGAVNYAGFTTDIYASKNGGAPVLIGNVPSGTTTFDHLTGNTTPYTAVDRWKYTLRHRMANGNTSVYSAYSAETTESSGVTSPPAAPSALNPNGASADPSQVIPMEWKHNSTDMSAQQAYRLRHRVQGSGTWTTTADIASAVSSHNLAAATYTNGTVVEWEVATKGADAAFGPYSATATFTAVLSKKVPVHLDTGTGRTEADLSGGGWTGFAKPAAKVRRDAAFSINTGGGSVNIPWDMVEFSRDGCTANSSGITIPRTGIYRVSAQLGLTTVSTSGGLVQVSVAVNGTTVTVLARGAVAGSSPTVVGGSTELLLNAGDVLTARAFHTNAAARDTYGDVYHTMLSASYNGPAS